MFMAAECLSVTLSICNSPSFESLVLESSLLVATGIGVPTQMISKFQNFFMTFQNYKS